MKQKKDLAVALEYEAGKDEAPKVTASGKGEIARAIIDKAKEHNIPIQEDPALIEALSKLDIGSFIPPELYKAVAEILAFIYRLDKEYAARQ